MFNFFKSKSNKEIQSVKNTEQNNVTEKSNKDELTEPKKAVHGENGVCCGGCGGQ